MAITDPSDISAALLAAQDSQTRKPLVEIISAPKENDIPFDGQFLTSEPRNVYVPATITHSSGRIITIASMATDVGLGLYTAIKYIYTDVDRLEFNHVDIQYDVFFSSNLVSCHLCELSDGTGNIGIVGVHTTGNYYRISRLTTSVLGVVVAAITSVFQITKWQHFSGPWVQTLGVNSYLMVYSYQTIVNISSPYTAIAFESGGTSSSGQDEITDSAGQFVVDGFVSGQRIYLNDTTSNDGFYEIDTVTTGKITLTSTTLLTTEAAISITDVYRNDYYLYTRTSTDFLTWSAESVALSISGTVSTDQISNPSILEIDSGDLFLWFDVIDEISANLEELKNIYYSVSSDSGATWGAAVNVSQNTSYLDIAEHPVAVQRTSDFMDVIYNKLISVLHMNEGDGQWLNGDNAFTVSFDSVNRHFYFINAGLGVGFQSVVQIDIDTWTVTDYWDSTTTTPGYPTGIEGQAVGYNNRLSDGDNVVFSRTKTGGGGEEYNRKQVWHLKGSPAPGVITGYYLDSSVALSLSKNVDDSSLNTEAGIYTVENGIEWTQYDASTDRIYLVLEDGFTPVSSFSLCYLDIGDYTLKVIINNNRTNLSVYELIYTTGYYIDTIGGYYIVTGGGTEAVNQSFCKVFDLASGGLIREWLRTDTRLPYFGLDSPFAYDNGTGTKIYAGLHSYTSSYSQSSFRGLVELDIATGSIITHRPSYSSDDDFTFGKPSLMDNDKIIMTNENHGVVSFDTVSKTWEIWNNANVSGLTQGGTETGLDGQVAFDATNGFIMVGDIGSGVLMFHEDGAITTSYYMEGEDDSGWTFGSANRFIKAPNGNYDAVATVEPSATSIYAFWENINSDDETEIKWDKDGSTTDISKYLVDGKEITTNHTIDGNPAALSFTVSHGYLFDTNNIASLLNVLFKKGRKLSLRWGETISGSPSWCNAGDFFVISTSTSLTRGKYPEMSVVAEDQRTLWQLGKVYATDTYNNQPDVILKSVLEAFAGMASAEIDMPTFVNGTALDNQWIDTNIEEITNQIMSRFGYYLRFDIDGKATANQITNVYSAGTIHKYTDSTKIVSFSQDDRYSDFTNRITVEGQEQDFTEVVYAEERIDQVNGTLGWWGQRAKHVVWYSDDKSRRALYPRMTKLQGDASIAFSFPMGGKVRYRITTPGLEANDKYCTVNVSAPDLTGQLLAFIGIAIAGALIPDWAVVTVLSFGVGAGTGPSFSVGRIVQQVGITGALLVLGSMASYQLEVHAQPVGLVRRSVQGTWDDTAHQTEIGVVVTQVFTDQLCYSAIDCQQVADIEGMIVQSQRNRVTFSKTAHLQDEDGDVIQVIHPYGGQAMDTFITDIRRRYKKGDSGYFLDDITGWVL